MVLCILPNVFNKLLLETANGRLSSTRLDCSNALIDVCVRSPVLKVYNCFLYCAVACSRAFPAKAPALLHSVCDVTRSALDSKRLQKNGAPLRHICEHFRAFLQALVTAVPAFGRACIGAAAAPSSLTAAALLLHTLYRKTASVSPDCKWKTSAVLQQVEALVF